MLTDLFFLACGIFAIWHFGRATYIAFKDRYVMWSSSRASAGSRVYRDVDPRRYRIGAWANVVGLVLSLAGAAFLVHEAMTGGLGR